MYTRKSGYEQLKDDDQSTSVNKSNAQDIHDDSDRTTKSIDTSSSLQQHQFASTNNGEFKRRRSKFGLSPDIDGFLSDELLAKKVGFFGLFKFASFFDKLLVFIGTIFAFIEGAGTPLMSLVFGNMSNTLVSALSQGFANSTTTTNPEQQQQQQVSISTSIANALSPINIQIGQTNMLTVQEFEATMTTFALYFVGIGVAVYVASVIQIYCLQRSAENQIMRIRQLFFQNVLRQELFWFDENRAGALASKLNDDIERIRDGLGDQYSLFMKQVSLFFIGFLVGFSISWPLTLIFVLVTPLLAIFSAMIGKLFATSIQREQNKYAEAGAIAEEALVSIRTVFALNGQKTELKAFSKQLDDARKISVYKYLRLSALVGVSFFVSYSTYGLALYSATWFLDANILTPGAAMAVLMCVMQASNALGQIVPPMQMVITAMSSAALVYKVIESKPTIDAFNDRGLKLSKVTANIRFDNVTFCYPLRPTLPVIQNLNIELSQGQTVAICGKTGSGKSTIINLLLRFYDPNYGSIYLDNCALTDLNVAWLRSLIGIVEQEPALFDCSISENIALGSTNDNQRTFDKIVAAAKLANAHEFISNLPEGYGTRCGDRGYQMSGGQKQRIAIARALLSDPKILLLDEATSALDSESESIVQLALNKARKGRTTVVIAHRLSTIRDADTICVMDGGKLVEVGKHDELMDAHNFYYNLVTSQVFDDEKSIEASNLRRNNKLNNVDDDDDIDDSEQDGSDQNISKSIDRATLSSTFRGSGLLDRDSSIAERVKKTSIMDSSSAFNKTPFELMKQSALHAANMAGIQDKQNERQKIDLTFKDLVDLLKPEAFMLCVAILFACISGFLLPLFGLMYAQIFDTLTQTGDALKSAGAFWSLMFVVLALANMISIFLRIFLMSRVIEKNSMRLRTECFRSILRQQVGWFDDAENTPQRLTARLSTDIPQVKAIINARLAALCSGLATIFLALIICFSISWQMALLQSAIIPILLYVGIVQMQISRKDRSSYMRTMEDASRLATEAIEHVKLVQAIGQERYFMNKYDATLRRAAKGTNAQMRTFAIIYGISVSTIYFVYGASFRFGGYLIAVGSLDPVNLFRVFFTVAFTAVAVGQWGGLGGDMSRSKEAVKSILALKNKQPIIDNLSPGGIKPKLKGQITFQNVHFRYPTRPDTIVLRNLNLTINPGTTLALVGPSGNGKSTIAALLLRFYDPTQGFVKIDNYDLRCLNLEHLRRNVAIVSQEPLLFKASIRENILYGLDANSYSLRDVIRAAKLANIDDFIQTLPDQYETQVGDRGTQMSGGQKQRIAIARAIVRNPAILILDEATSALDSESEHVVSQAIEKACAGKTCIKIAHRLSTIRDADQIAVIEKGAIIELGTHDQLMALGRNGFYFRLMQKQEITS